MRYLFVFALLSLSSIVSAKPWSIESAFQFSKNTGNVDDRSIGFENTFVYDASKLKLTGIFNYLSFRENDRLTSEEYFTECKSDFKHSKDSYFFTFFRWEKDKFKDLDYRSTAGVGYGMYLIYKVEKENKKLTLEFGGLRSKEHPVGEVPISFTSARIFLGYKQVFSEHLSFNFGNEYIYEINSTRGYLLTNIFDIVSKINSRWSFKTGFRRKYDSNPPGLAVNRDTRIAISLVTTL